MGGGFILSQAPSPAALLRQGGLGSEYGLQVVQRSVIVFAVMADVTNPGREIRNRDQPPVQVGEVGNRLGLESAHLALRTGFRSARFIVHTSFLGHCHTTMSIPGRTMRPGSSAFQGKPSAPGGHVPHFLPTVNLLPAVSHEAAVPAPACSAR